jgi:3-phosphoinositide dependent protein kinase-1
LKLGDFGTAFISQMALNKFRIKENRTETENTRWDTFVGTSEYVSPEVLKSLGSSQPADIWSLGCIIYQLLVGKTPFAANCEYDIF